MLRRALGLLCGATTTACVLLSGASDLEVDDGAARVVDGAAGADSRAATDPRIDGGGAIDAGPLAPCEDRPVLVLGNGWRSSFFAAKSLLEEAGLRVTTLETYADAGTTDPTVSEIARASAILLLTGHSYPAMPEPVQRALVDAHARGVGLVFEEWVSYYAGGPLFALLEPLMLQRADDFRSLNLSLVAVDPNHPVWRGLPSTVRIRGTAWVGYPVGSATPGPAPTVLARADLGPDAGIKDAILALDGAGRIAQSVIAADYLGTESLANDSQLRRLYANMVRWVARCEAATLGP